MSNKSKSLLRRAMRWLFRHPVRHFAILWLALLHGGMVHFHVEPLEPDLYNQWATDIRVTPHWRYGYVSGYHGAHLCKARNVPEAAPEPLADDDARPKIGLIELMTPQDEQHDKALAEAMTRDLDSFPARAWGETLFFAGLMGFAFWLGPWLWRRLAPPGERPAWAVCLAALLWMLGWALALSPFLIFDYGASLYTTYAGPGALVYSGPHPGLPTGLGGETLTYRPLLETICLFPILCVGATGIGNWLPENASPALLVAGLIFCGLLGAIVGLIRWLLIWDALRQQALCVSADHGESEGAENAEHKERM